MLCNSGQVLMRTCHSLITKVTSQSHKNASQNESKWKFQWHKSQMVAFSPLRDEPGWRYWTRVTPQLMSSLFHLSKTWHQYVISLNPKHSTGNEIRLGSRRNARSKIVNTAMPLQIPFAHSKFLVIWCKCVTTFLHQTRQYWKHCATGIRSIWNNSTFLYL